MIYHDVPRPVEFGWFKLTAHLMSDLHGEDGTREIDAFAGRCGLRVEWRQNSGTPTEHYDLFDRAIDRAIAAGSVEVTSRELVELCVRPKRAAAQQGAARIAAAWETHKAARPCGTTKAPPGWWCTRLFDHEGPCAAVETDEYGRPPSRPEVPDAE